MIRVARKNDPRMFKLPIRRISTFPYHCHVLCFTNDRVCDGHLFQTGTNCSAGDFDSEDQCAVPFLGTAEFLFPLQEDVDGVLDTAQTLGEDHAGGQIG